jgi:hypothetical protein
MTKLFNRFQIEKVTLIIEKTRQQAAAGLAIFY